MGPKQLELELPNIYTVVCEIMSFGYTEIVVVHIIRLQIMVSCML